MKSGKQIKEELLDLMEKHYAETQDDNIEIWLPDEQWRTLHAYLSVNALEKGSNVIYFYSPNVSDCQIIRYFGTLTGVRRKGEFAERSLKLLSALRGVP